MQSLNGKNSLIGVQSKSAVVRSSHEDECHKNQHSTVKTQCTNETNNKNTHSTYDEIDKAKSVIDTQVIAWQCGTSKYD